MKRKICPAVFALAVSAILLSGWLSDALGAEWVRFATDPLGNELFYDKGSISPSSGGVTRVWMKKVFSDEGLTFLMNEYANRGQSTQGLASLQHELGLLSVKCAASKYKFDKITLYRRDGAVLNSFSYPDDDWTDMSPDSTADLLKREICKKVKRKK